MIRHKAKVENGALQLDNTERFLKELSQYEGKDISVEIKRYRKHRSNNQNRYLWGCVYKKMSECSDHSEEEIHDAMRWKFLKVHGDKIETVRSTTQLSTVEFEEYVARVRQFASEFFGLFIPLPHETMFY